MQTILREVLGDGRVDEDPPKACGIHWPVKMSRKMLSNASYFAFTATPKNKTLEIFGTPFDAGGVTRRRPFHSYTMKPVSYTHLRAHETVLDLVCRLLLEKKKKSNPHLTPIL